MAMDPERASQVARDCWRKGTEALNSKNWDFAIEMFFQAVKLVPDNMMYRQVLRGSEHKKYDDNGKGAKMSGPRLMGVRKRIKSAKGKEDWDTVDQEAEEGLKLNPWDAQLNFALGEACAKREYYDVAIFAFGEAVKAEKDNVEFLKALGDAHLEKENFDEASRFWGRVYELEPHNGEARTKVSHIQVQKATKVGGYRDAESTRDVKTEKTAYEQARGSRQTETVLTPGEDPFHDLEMAIRKAPDKPDNYIKLAQLYRAEKKYDEALQRMKKAVEVSGNDPNVEEIAEDIEIDLLRQRLDRASEAVKAKPDDADTQKQRTKLAQQLIKREIDIYSTRVERYPKNTQIKFELAKRYKRVKQFEHAIKLFQQAVADSRLEAEALVNLGECFIAENKLPLAKRQFDRAVPKLDKHDNPDLFKSTHYMLGRLSEKSGNLEEAESHYSDILEIDYGYKDVVKRLESIQSGSKPADDAE